VARVHDSGEGESLLMACRFATGQVVQRIRDTVLIQRQSQDLIGGVWMGYIEIREVEGEIVERCPAEGGQVGNVLVVHLADADPGTTNGEGW